PPFRRPSRLLYRQRQDEPRPIRIDLGRMRQQCSITNVVVVGAGDPSSDTSSMFGVFGPVTEPLGVRRLEAARDHCAIQRHSPIAVESKRVIELERLPWFTELWVSIRVGRCFK